MDAEVSFYSTPELDRTEIKQTVVFSIGCTAAHFDVREVSADKAYLSRKNLNAVEVVSGMPFIPFKINTLEPTEAATWARMYHLFMVAAGRR